jgi:hypothetical protein
MWETVAICVIAVLIVVICVEIWDHKQQRAFEERMDMYRKNYLLGQQKRDRSRDDNS